MPLPDRLGPAYFGDIILFTIVEEGKYSDPFGPGDTLRQGVPSSPPGIFHIQGLFALDRLWKSVLAISPASNANIKNTGNY
jgi:hypothetical protein